MKLNKNFEEYIRVNRELDEQEEEIIVKKQKAFDRLILEEGNSSETLFLVRLTYYEIYKDKMVKRINELRKFDYEE